MLLFSMTIVRRVMKMVALAVTQEVMKVIAAQHLIYQVVYTTRA